MLQQQQYVSEKLKEVGAARRHVTSPLPVERQPSPRRRGPIGVVARVAGRRVRRFGEALESWATPQTAAR